MKITIEIDEKNELDKLVAFFKTFKIDKVNLVPTVIEQSSVVKGDKTIDPTALFGVWAKAPKNLADIRAAGWRRK